MAKVIIPTPLRRFTENQPTLVTESGTVLQAIEELGNKYPGLHPHLFDKEGKLRNFIRIYVGDEDIKTLDNGNTAIDATSIVSLVPAIAGGSN
jgi:molybdopterin converting factor small subunit